MIKYAKKYFKYYIEEAQNKKRYILIQKIKSDGCIRRWLMPLDTRYSKKYQREVKKRMRWLINQYGNKNAVSLVLTLDPKKFNNNTYEMWSSIKKEMNRFLTALRYYFKKQSNSFPKYIVTLEAQKNGNPHLHFVFLGCKRLLDWRKIRKLWHLGHISINRTYQGTKIQYPINYITKYITKTFTTTSEKNLLTQSLLWLFNIRSYSSSKGLLFPIKPKSQDNCEPLCLIIGYENITLFDLEEIINIHVTSPLDPILKDHWIKLIV